MRTLSPGIETLLRLAESDGNSIAETSTGWEKARQVVHMSKPMSPAVRKVGEGDPGLRFWAVEGSPHYRAACGFIDEVELVSIEFPRD